MSGGHFDYQQHRIEDIARSIEELIENNDSTEKDEYGDDIGYHYDVQTIRKFKQAVINLRISGIMVQRIDYLVSGDDGEESFRRRWDDELNQLLKSHM